MKRSHSKEKLKRKLFNVRSLIPIPVILLVFVAITYTLASIYFTWDRFGDRGKASKDLDFDYDEAIDTKIASHRRDGDHSLSKTVSESYVQDYLKLHDSNELNIVYDVKNHAHYCEHENGYKRLLIAITSPQENYHSRALIRRTFGSLRKFRRWTINTVFFIRSSNSTPISIINSLKNESAHYGDIVVTLPLPKHKIVKHPQLPVYKWTIKNCKDADFVLKATDYVYIDVFQVAEIVTHYHDLKHVLICKRRHQMSVDRNKIPEKDFQPHLFPSHCSSEAMIMSKDALQLIYVGSMNAKLKFPMMENLWTTGIIRENAELNITNIGYKFCDMDMYFKYIKWASDKNHGRDQKFQWVVMSLPKLTLEIENEVDQLWNKTVTVYKTVYDFEVSSL